MPKKAIIIGGGIIGLSIAYNLVKNNIKVTILEKNKLGKEASWAAAGMLRPQAEFENEDLLRLSLQSIELYSKFASDLEAETDIDINYRRDGTIILAINNEQLKELKERYSAQQRINLDVKWLTNKELVKLEPNINRNTIGAVLIKGDHWADNRLIVEALIKTLKKYNGEIHEDCAVKSYIHKQDKVIGVEASSGNFLGDFIINSAGSWAGQIKSNNIRLIPPIKPILGQLIEVKCPNWLIRHNVCTYSSYLAPKNENTILIGSTTEDVGFDKRVTVSGISQLINNAIELVPKIRDCRFLSAWAGFRPTTPDKLPILGKTNAEGLLIATGTYRNGILLAPIIGKLISEIIISGSEPKEIEAFKIERFYK